jgi:RNA polymerase primary sigma factor
LSEEQVTNSADTPELNDELLELLEEDEHLPTTSEALQEIFSEAEEDEDEDELPFSYLNNVTNIAALDSISLYLNTTGRVPLLTREEEIELAQRIQRGEEAQARLENGVDAPEERAELLRRVEAGNDARRRFIEANTRLVVSIAKKYRGYGLPFMDLIQAGNLGLIKAVDRFDYEMGNRFSTYATWWIRQSIIRHLMQQKRTIRIPVHVSNSIRKLRKAIPALVQKLGRWPTSEELAEHLDLPLEEVERLQRLGQPLVSLNTSVGGEEETELEYFIKDESMPSPFSTVQQRLLREDLKEIMATALTPREVRVLTLRWGLEGNRRYTLQELADQLGISRERVRQIERKAIRKLRNPYHRRKLRDYIG